MPGNNNPWYNRNWSNLKGQDPSKTLAWGAFGTAVALEGFGAYAIGEVQKQNIAVASGALDPVVALKVMTYGLGIVFAAGGLLVGLSAIYKGALGNINDDGKVPVLAHPDRFKKGLTMFAAGILFGVIFTALTAYAAAPATRIMAAISAPVAGVFFAKGGQNMGSAFEPQDPALVSTGGPSAPALLNPAPYNPDGGNYGGGAHQYRP